MPFQEKSKMDLRRQMILRVREGELNVSQAAREYDVARNTVKLWLGRADACGAGQISEISRRPRRCRQQTPEEIELKVLALKARKPGYGAKKLLAVLWPDGAPISVRTGDRILERNGLVNCRRPREDAAVQRFERSEPNELWQMDFKGLGLRPPSYSPLSVLDDAARFCLAFEPLPDQRSETIFLALWNVFGEYGLPQAILSDNEPCFADVHTKGPSWLEARLWLLGIRTPHGRPRHPQTQGKVERFHGTVQRELGPELRQPSIPAAKERFDRYVAEYNYERPHEALGMRMPGTLYRASALSRPSKLPEHHIPEGATARKVDAAGKFTYKGHTYRASHGLYGQHIVIQEREPGLCVTFAGRAFALLSNLTT
jgi:transposase InsO family protein